jgi:hypothetical protein
MVSAQGEWYWQQRMGILCSRTLSMHAWKLCSSSSYLRWAQLLPLLLIHKIVSSSTTTLIYSTIFWSAYVLETSHLLACTRYIKRHKNNPIKNHFQASHAWSIHPSIDQWVYTANCHKPMLLFCLYADSQAAISKWGPGRSLSKKVNNLLEHM